jgi:hypothetical protein
MDVNVVELLDKVIEVLDKAQTAKARTVNTIGTAEKMLKAVETADLGETERAVISRLSRISTQAKELVGCPEPAVV